MNDPARDPRQLARDILAGKISIEDLARQQAQRRGPVVPNRQVPMPQQRPVQQVPPRQPIQQVPFPTAPQRQPQPIRQAPFPTVLRGPKPVRQVAPAGPRIVGPRPAAEPTLARRLDQQAATAAAATAAATPALPGATLAALMASRDNLRRGIVLAEVLGPPVSLRDRF